MIRKALLILLSIVLLSCGFPAVAEETPEVPEFTDMPYAGIRFFPPEEYKNARGLILTEGSKELAPGVQYAYWLYCAVSEAEKDLLYNNPDITRIANLLFYVFTVGNGMNFDDMNTLLGNTLSPSFAREIGKNGLYTTYLYMEDPNPDFAMGLDEAYADEYTTLASQPDLAASSITCYEPISEYAYMIGKKIEFTTKDLQGNSISSEELFAQHEITMVNIWATWCGPCVGELAELQQIHLRLQEKDCGVVGLLADTDYASARKLIQNNGMTYPVLQFPDSLMSQVPVQAYPTTYFIGRDGAVLGAPIEGAYVSLYEKAINSLLVPQEE